MTARSRSRRRVAALAAAGLALAAAPAAAQSPPAPGISPDTRFAPPSGIAKYDFTSGTAADVTGGIVVVGDRIYTVGETRNADGDADIGILARRPNGTFDGGFSGDGRTTIAVAPNVGTNRGRDAGFAVVALPDGRLRIAAAVDLDSTATVNLDIAVVGVMPDGALDPSFGGGDGIVTFPVGIANDTPTRMALDPVTGRIAVTGTAVVDAKDNFFVALLEPNGTPAAFGTGGVRTYNRGGVTGANVEHERPRDRRHVPARRRDPRLPAGRDQPGSQHQRLVRRAARFHRERRRRPDVLRRRRPVLTVGNPDTIPGAITVYGDQLWLTGSTKNGQHRRVPGPPERRRQRPAVAPLRHARHHRRARSGRHQPGQRPRHASPACRPRSSSAAT